MEESKSIKSIQPASIAGLKLDQEEIDELFLASFEMKENNDLNEKVFDISCNDSSNIFFDHAPEYGADRGTILSSAARNEKIDDILFLSQ